MSQNRRSAQPLNLSVTILRPGVTAVNPLETTTSNRTLAELFAFSSHGSPPGGFSARRGFGSCPSMDRSTLGSTFAFGSNRSGVQVARARAGGWSLIDENLPDPNVVRNSSDDTQTKFFAFTFNPFAGSENP